MIIELSYMAVCLFYNLAQTCHKDMCEIKYLGCACDHWYQNRVKATILEWGMCEMDLCYWLFSGWVWQTFLVLVVLNKNYILKILIFEKNMAFILVIVY